METTICGISAMQYAMTPPLLRDVTLNPEDLRRSASAGGISVPRRLFITRADSRDADRLVRGRLCGELKGISLPVQAYVGKGQSPRRSSCVAVRPREDERILSHRMPLGNGLHVLSPEAALCTISEGMSPIKLAELIFSACGIYSLLPCTKRCQLAAEGLLSDGVLDATNFTYASILGYSDERGVPLAHVDWAGNCLPWSPVFDRKGKLTNMWKRAPLTSVAEIARVADEFELGPRHPLRRALGMALNGSGSPAETKALLLLCSGVWNGGESFGKPDLNRRVGFTREAGSLAHGNFCIADALWVEHKRILEVNGTAFHADRDGFRISSGRTAALENMGYTVADLLYEQMADLKLFDAVLPTLAEKLGFALQKRTTAFLQRRNHLHKSLFGSQNTYMTGKTPL